MSCLVYRTSLFDGYSIMNDIHCWQSKFKPCLYSDKLINKIKLLNKQTKTGNKIDLHEVKKAIYYAKKYHGFQKRLSGEPYYIHPIIVAEMVIDYIFKTEIIVTSILHDIIEDTDITKEHIKCIFNHKVAENVENLTRIKSNEKITSAQLIELLLIHNKYELLIVKVFDRIHNMQTLEAQSLKAQERISLETLKKFLPMLAYCSLIDLEKQLGDLCYKIRSKYFEPNSIIYHFDLEENYQLLFQAFQSIK